MARTRPDPPARGGARPVGSLADSLTVLARRRGVAVADEGTLLGLLTALDPRPLIPHELLLVAGTVMAGAFRRDRALAGPPAGDAGSAGHADSDNPPDSADCSL